MVVTVGVNFNTDVTVFIGLLASVLGVNQAVILPILEVLVVNVFGLIVN